MTSDLASALESASRHWDGGSPTGAMLSATRGFLVGADQDAAVLKAAADCLTTGEPGAAAWIAVACGTAVETGASPDTTGPAVFELFRSWLPKLPAEADPTPSQKALLPLFQFLCQSVVTHLARLPTQRESMGRDLALIERLGELQDHSYGAVWVREALLKSSGTIFLLHPETRTGLRLRYVNVSNNFHLFSLLQTAVGTKLTGGRIPNGTVARVARGTSTERVDDEAWWHYGDASSPKPDMCWSIWGEGLVRDIALVDGARIILAWSPILATRTWDAGFLGPHLEALPADVIVEGELTTEECEQWLTRLGIERAAAPKPWWRLW